MKISGEVILLLCINTSKAREDLTRAFNRRFEKQKIYGLERYFAIKKRAPYLLTLKPEVALQRNEKKIVVRPEVRLYFSGACCLRFRVGFHGWSVDEVVLLMRDLRLQRGNIHLINQKISLKEYIDWIIRKISGDGMTGKIRTQYIVIIVDGPAIDIGKNVKEIAALVTWQRDWREFNPEYIKKILWEPIPAKRRGGFIIVKFPSTLLHLPGASATTRELYLLVIELARVQLHMLKIYSYKLDDIVEKIKKIQQKDPHEFFRDLWKVNMLRLEVLYAVEDIKKARDILQVHRLLWVFDRLVDETHISRLYEHIHSKLTNINEIISSCYNLLSAEYSRREQMEIYYLQYIFVIGVIIQAVMLLFVKLADFTILGIPLIATTVFSGMLLFQMFRKIVSRKMRDHKNH